MTYNVFYSYFIRRVQSRDFTGTDQMGTDTSVASVSTTIGASEGVVDMLGRKQLRALMARRDGPGLLFLAGHLALMAATGTLVWLSLGTYWIVGAVFLHGIVIVHLFAPLHECTHRTAFRSRWLNETVYWLCGLTLGLMPWAFRFQHADHHTYTQDIHRDPQMIPMGERLSGYLFYASAVPYFTGIAKALLRYPIGRFTQSERNYIPANMLKSVQRQAWIYWGVYLGIAAVSIGLESWAALVYWLIPRIVAEPVERIIRLSEHTACAHSRNMLENSRTTLTWPPIRWLSWNMPLHAAHHAVPLVPFHAIPKLNDMLSDHLREVRHGYFAAVRFQLSNAWNNRSQPAPA